MKKTINILLLLAAFATTIISCSSGNLNEEKARLTVNKLLAKGRELPDNCCPPAELIEWRGLVQISETELHGGNRKFFRRLSSF
jgi:hypothetical protein